MNYTHTKHRTQFFLLEEILLPNEEFYKNASSKLFWMIDIKPTNIDEEYTFMIAGTYKVFDSNQTNADFLRISGGHIFTISALDPKNPDISVLEQCFTETHNALRSYVEEKIKDSLANNFTYPYLDIEAVRTNIHIRLVNLQ